MSGTILPTMCPFFGSDPIKFKKKLNLIMSHSKTALCMPVIPFPSERVLNSSTFMCRHSVLTTIINFSNLHLKNHKK